MKRAKKKHVKQNNSVNEYFYLFGILPLSWTLTIPVTFLISIKTHFSILLLDFIIAMQIIFILYAIYEIKSNGYSLTYIYSEHKKELKGFRHNIVPVQIIFYILFDIVIIAGIILHKF